MQAPCLGITMGDPAGVGPEIIVKACRRLRPRLDAGEMRLLVIGHRTALHAALSVLGDTEPFPDVPAPDVPAPDLAVDEPPPLPPPLPPLGMLSAADESKPIGFGQVNPEAGRFAYLAVERAVTLAQAGTIDAIVTAPLNKEALTHTKSSVMLLAHGDMRVSHVTTHTALENVPKLLTPERLRRTIDITHQAMLDLGIDRPRIAVAALNPHAGEGGL